MTTPPAPPARSRPSLERRLPLVITGLLVLIVGTVLGVTYREMTRTSLGAASDALGHSARELAATAEGALKLFRGALREFGAEPAVRRALARRRLDGPALALVLDRLRETSDSGVQFAFWDAAGRSVGTVGVDRAAIVDADARGVLPPRDDSTHVGRLHAVGGKVVYWVVSPMIDGARRTGWVAQRRGVGNTPQSLHAIRGIIGPGATVFFRNRSGDVWAAVDGSPAQPPTDLEFQYGRATYIDPARPTAGRLLVQQAAAIGTPWVVTLDRPMADILRRPRAALVRLMVLCLALLALGSVAAWAISRRLTHPLADLTAAAESIARGDFTRRIAAPPGSQRDEVGRLAASFNYMVSELSAARTALEQQVEEAKSARLDAESANRAKSEFLATMSHELRTPLNAIAGYTELIELEIYGAVTQGQREALQRIRRSDQTLLALVDDVLNFARIEAGRIEYHPESLSVDEKLRELQPMIAPQARAKNVAFDYRPLGAGATVWADPDRFDGIVLNILSNAVKFTNAGGHITLEGERRGEEMFVRVTDTGRGIAAAQLESIFEPFIQGERGLTRTIPGTGLGLAISREFARAMDGDLTVESTLGQGSTFTLRLPASAREREEGGGRGEATDNGDTHELAGAPTV